MALMLLLLLLLFIACGLYQGLKTTRYQVKSAKITSPVKLLLLSDLHAAFWGREQCQLVDIVLAEKPDAILLAGDIADLNGDPAAVQTLIEKIAPLAPVFYVTGNHDLMTWDIASVTSPMRALGVHCLRNTSLAFALKGNPIVFTGVDEPFEGFIEGCEGKKACRAWYLKKLEGLAPKNSEVLNVLIAHRPEYVNDYARLGFDLSVSGHAHGGQWRIPFLLPQGLFAPGQGLFPKTTGGCYHRRQLTHIVSSGLHFSFLRPRFFNRPEVVVIELIKQERGNNK